MRSFAKKFCAKSDGLWTVATSALIALGVYLAPNQTKAAFITIGCSAVNSFCTLEELQNPSAFINIDGVFFNNFLMFAGPANLIKVTPLDAAGSGRGSAVGLRFEPLDPAKNPWFVEIPLGSDGPASFSSLFSYTVTDLSLSQSLIDNAALRATFIENVSGGFYESLFATMEFLSPSIPTLMVDCQGAGLPFAACDGATVTQRREFEGAQTFLVEHFLFGEVHRFTGGGTVEAGITQLDSVFFAVPEPTTLSLFAAALGLLAAAARRRGPA